MPTQLSPGWQPLTSVQAAPEPPVPMGPVQLVCQVGVVGVPPKAAQREPARHPPPVIRLQFSEHAPVIGITAPAESVMEPQTPPAGQSVSVSQ